jgi:hypothetical protein
MTAPLIIVEFGKGFNLFASQWIQMNVSDQFLEIGFFFTYNRFIPILK